jgi:DegV family protein with EDD domain
VDGSPLIRIVTDSTCDLPAELLDAHRITVVPINIQFGQESYQEGVTLDAEGFYRMVEEHNQLPTTSQPSLGQFQAAYRSLRDEPDTEAILSVHITSHLSGTYDAAVVGAGQMPPEPPITVFDSLSGSMGLGFMVLEAAQMIQAGVSLPAILVRLETLRERMHIFFSLDDLRFARMSGRVGVPQALLASLLQIKPMLTVTEGKLGMVKRVRSRVQALQSLVDALSERLGDRPACVAVIHAQAPETAEQVQAMVAERVRVTQMFVHELSVGIAVHFGPGTVGVVGYNP